MQTAPFEDIYKAVMIVEGEETVETEEEVIAAWQLLVNTGVAWKLQGRIGRTAKDLIESGLVTLPS